jgi:F420-dependent oxidoreductase-like protein
MRVCLMIEGQESVTWEDWVRIARLTEEKGLEGLFRSDHYTAIIQPQGAALDAWTTLAGLATQTERIRLGTLVSPGTFRHPSVLARMAVTVDHISSGRVEVGMGSGWYEREHVENGFLFLDSRRRFELFEEQVAVVVGSWTEDGFTYDGVEYSLRDQTALPRPYQQPHPPLVLGGTVRPRFAALAARYATEVNTLGAPTEELKARRQRLDEACREIGREPESLVFSLMTTCYLGETETDVLDRIRRFEASRESNADPAQLLEERRGRWIAGSVEQVAERLEELAKIGVTRVFLQHLNHTDDDMVSLIGDRLIPAVAA